MEITSRQRGAKLGRTISFSDKKCNINFDLNIFSMLCNYCVSSNKNIRRSDLIMLRNLIDAMNMDLFINEPEKIARIDFIKRALEIRIQHGNINRVLLIQGAMDGLTGETIVAPKRDNANPMPSVLLPFLFFPSPFAPL